MSKVAGGDEASIETLKSMFPGLDADILKEVFNSSGKNLETATEFLLQEIVPGEKSPTPKMGSSGTKSQKETTPPKEVASPSSKETPAPKNNKTEIKNEPPKGNDKPADKTKESSSSGLKPEDVKNGIKQNSEAKTKEKDIKASLTYSHDSSGGYYEDDDGEDGDNLRDSGMWDDEIFTSDGKAPLPMNPEINPNIIDKEVAFLPPVEEQLVLSCLNKMQADAVKYVVDKSKKESELQFPEVLARVKRLGFTEDDLKKTLKYIRDEAPIIVHLNLDRVMHLIVKDSHYRNQFETNMSGGTLSSTSRIDWENRLFNKIYGQVATNGFERVKYGVLNIVSDPMGVRCCSGYGDSYLVLKKVRLRTTFASKDTSAADVKLASCEYYCHVMKEWNDKEIEMVIKVAIGKMKSADSSIISFYKEVQIHGPLKFEEHVEKIVTNKRHENDKNMKELITKFCEKNKIKHVWMHTLT